MDLLFSTGNSAQYYVAAWIGRDFGEEWIQVYVQLDSFAAHLKISQHFKSVILQYNKINIYRYIITTGVTIVTAELQLSLFANFKSHVVNREKHQSSSNKEVKQPDKSLI